MTLRLDHLVVPVADMAASLRFYRDVLGLPLEQAIEGDDWDGLPWLMVLLGAGDGRQLVLVGFRGGPRAPADPFPKDSRHITAPPSAPAPRGDAAAVIEAWLARR